MLGIVKRKDALCGLYRSKNEMVVVEVEEKSVCRVVQVRREQRTVRLVSIGLTE